MATIQINANALNTFKEGVKDVVEAYRNIPYDSRVTYRMGNDNPEHQISAKLDELTDAFIGCLINDCLDHVTSDINIRLQIAELAYRVGKRPEEVEEYIMNKKSVKP